MSSLRGRARLLGVADGRQLALRLLARRECAAAELTARLRQQGLSRDDAEAVVDALQQQDLQSDRRYAELIWRSRVSQGLGRARIVAELVCAGVATDTIAASEAELAIDWPAELQRLYQRRFGNPPADRQTQLAQARYLLGRGHPPAAVWSLLRGADDGD